MMKAFKNITLALLISLALACSGLAQQSGNQWAPQKDRKKEPERPVEKEKKEDRGGEKKDDGGKKGKKP